jgi:cell division transport system permease protein
MAFLLTTLALGVAISLPTGLYLALGTLGRLAGDLPARPEISVFVADAASVGDKRAIAARVQQPDIAEHRFVPKAEALTALSTFAGLADVAAGLGENPLPDAWVVLAQTHSSREDVSRLADELRGLRGVDEVHLDGEWADRLLALLALGRTVVWVLGGLFAIALLAISGNAIRSQVLARREEIEVSRLIGATDRHIRRPFLYLGALQGLLGGLAAGGVLAFSARLLQGPIDGLAKLYGSTFHLLPPTLGESLAVLGLTTLFGLLGAWTTVNRTLRQVEVSAH